MDKRNFYLFRRRTEGKERFEYIQYLISPSYNEGLSCSSWPEYAWRGLSTLDVKKMEYMISISKNYNKYKWELVIYNMEVEQQSWANQPEPKQYEDLLKGKKLRRLTPEEQKELEDFKQKINEIWKRKEIIPTKETPM